MKSKRVYVIRDKEGKCLTFDSRFLFWNEMPIASFWNSVDEAKKLCEEYLPGYSTEVCEFEMSWEEVTHAE